jgi:hypothetical protein
MDILAEHLPEQRDRCSLQAVCAALRCDGERSAVLNRNVELGAVGVVVEAIDVESFIEWLAKRAPR